MHFSSQSKWNKVHLSISVTKFKFKKQQFRKVGVFKHSLINADALKIRKISVSRWFPFWRFCQSAKVIGGMVGHVGKIVNVSHLSIEWWTNKDLTLSMCKSSYQLQASACENIFLWPSICPSIEMQVVQALGGRPI